jgi:hypothetical protein
MSCLMLYDTDTWRWRILIDKYERGDFYGSALAFTLNVKFAYQSIPYHLNSVHFRYCKWISI